jgi:hypothetical protein
VTLPIPGSRQPAHIDENLHAALVGLHPDSLARIRLLNGTGT